MATLVAHIAGALRLRAVPSYVAHLGAVVAGGFIRGVFAVLGDVADAITAVAVILLLLAVAGKVTRAVALVAFFPGPATSPGSWTTAHGTFPSKVAHAVTFVTL